MKEVNINLLLGAGLLVGGYFAIRKLLVSTGLANSADTEKGIQQVQQQENKLNIWAGVPALLKSYPKRKIVLLSESGSTGYAKELNNSMGTFNDDEEAIYGVFRSIRYKSQVASIVTAFYKLYNKDLLASLKSHLKDSELANVGNIINSKPLGIS